MSGFSAQSGMAQAYVEMRRGRIRCWIANSVQVEAPGTERLPEARIDHLLREAEELYWNELSWEQATDEEVVSGGRFTELVFPGFLTFIDGLLLREPQTGHRPHPEVVEQILLYLAEQYVGLTSDLEKGADSQRVVWARAMTARLIDLVLYRLYQLTSEECEELDAAT